MKISIALLFILSFLVMSCVQQKGLYYWGDYSESLFIYKQTPNDENLSKHKESILDIIEYSKKLNKKVPPGIYCEYGYILAKEGLTEEAKQYYELEAKTYPESANFIKKLTSNL